MKETITQKPPAKEDKYEDPSDIPTFDRNHQEEGKPPETGVTVQGAGHSPDPTRAINHYLAYRVRRRTPGRFRTRRVTLTDQFEREIFTVRGPVRLYNPVAKKVGLLLPEPIVDPNAHLVAYTIKGVHDPVNLIVTDQLHPRGLRLETSRPDLLLVPSSKTLGFGGSPPASPENIADHYKCYRVQPLDQFIQRVVTLSDQFITKPFIVREPVRFCNPVEKEVGGGAPVPINNPLDHLMCYLLEPKGKLSIDVQTNNQFGPEMLEVLNEEELCVHARKFVLSDG